jgi:pilus assembly protein Flp/PilA
MTPWLTNLLRDQSKLFHDQQGTSAVEYGVILSLIVLVMLVGATNLGSENSRMWNFVANTVSSADAQAAS